jgi:hypothetical protein
VDDGHRPAQYLPETTGAGPLQTRVDPAPRRHQAFAPPVKVVLITQRNLRTHGRAPVSLLSRDLTLADAPRVDDDRVRGHIECHGRDATPSGGREDVMNVTPTGGTTAAHLSRCMGHVADQLQADGRQRAPDARLLALAS